MSGLTEGGLDDSPRSVRVSISVTPPLPPVLQPSCNIFSPRSGSDDFVMCAALGRNPTEECSSADLLETRGWTGSSPYISWISNRISGGSEAKTEGSNSESAGKFVVGIGARFFIFCPALNELFVLKTLDSLEAVVFFISADADADGPERGGCGSATAYQFQSNLRRLRIG